MAVPARRTSKMRKNTRRSHDALVAQTTSNCSNCGSVVSPHHACMKCKMYKGQNIFQTTFKAAKSKTKPISVKSAAIDDKRAKLVKPTTK